MDECGHVFFEEDCYDYSFVFLTCTEYIERYVIGDMIEV